MICQDDIKLLISFIEDLEKDLPSDKVSVSHEYFAGFHNGKRRAYRLILDILNEIID